MKLLLQYDNLVAFNKTLDTNIKLITHRNPEESSLSRYWSAQLFREDINGVRNPVSEMTYSDSEVKAVLLLFDYGERTKKAYSNEHLDSDFIGDHYLMPIQIVAKIARQVSGRLWLDVDYAKERLQEKFIEINLQLDNQYKNTQES